MKKIDMNDINIKFNQNEYIYQIVVKDINISIKRIRIKKNVKECDFIIIKENNVDIKKIIFDDSKKCEKHLSNKEKNKVVNSIIYNLKKNNMCCDVFNLDELKKIIKNSFINIIIANENIALSNPNIEDIINNDTYNLDVILLDKNDIIGTLYFKGKSINFEGDIFYFNEVKDLINNYLCLFKDEKKLLKKYED